MIELPPEQLEQLADLVASRLQRPVGAALVGVREVAAYLAVEPSWVYEHASELDARRLGSGPRARLRFSLADVDERLSTCRAGRGSSLPDLASEQASRPPRRRRSGTSADLLPIRGRKVLS